MSCRYKILRFLIKSFVWPMTVCCHYCKLLTLVYRCDFLTAERRNHLLHSSMLELKTLLTAAISMKRCSCSVEGNTRGAKEIWVWTGELSTNWKTFSNSFRQFYKFITMCITYLHSGPASQQNHAIHVSCLQNLPSSELKFPTLHHRKTKV